MNKISYIIQFTLIIIFTHPNRWRYEIEKLKREFKQNDNINSI